MAQAKTKTTGAAKRARAGKGSPLAAAVKGRKTMAERRDPFALYESSVQRPEDDVAFFAETYRRLRGREAKVLREDFCGTAYISATWAGSGKGRRAIGVDLDAATLQLGQQPAGVQVRGEEEDRPPAVELARARTL